MPRYGVNIEAREYFYVEVEFDDEELAGLSEGDLRDLITEAAYDTYDSYKPTGNESDVTVIKDLEDGTYVLGEPPAIEGSASGGTDGRDGPGPG